MSALPVIISFRGSEDIRGLPIDLRAAVFEHLSRIGANHATCSRPTAYPTRWVWSRAFGSVGRAERLNSSKSCSSSQQTRTVFTFGGCCWETQAGCRTG